MLAAAGEHETVTTSWMGWADLKNGELLRAAEESGFDVFVTGDKSLVDEQNLAGRRLAIVALSANNCQHLAQTSNTPTPTNFTPNPRTNPNSSPP